MPMSKYMFKGNIKDARRTSKDVDLFFFSFDFEQVFLLIAMPSM